MNLAEQPNDSRKVEGAKNLAQTHGLLASCLQKVPAVSQTHVYTLPLSLSHMHTHTHTVCLSCSHTHLFSPTHLHALPHVHMHQQAHALSHTYALSPTYTLTCMHSFCTFFHAQTCMHSHVHSFKCMCSRVYTLSHTLPFSHCHILLLIEVFVSSLSLFHGMHESATIFPSLLAFLF